MAAGISAGEAANTAQGHLPLAFGAFILIGLNDGAVGVLLPSVIAHYHITTATVGLLFPASALGYLVAAFNIGALLERLGRRALLATGAGVWTAGALLFATLPPFAALLPAVFAAGFGMAILDAGLNAWVAELPRGASRLNYLHAFYGVGALLGPLLASALLASVLGWNATYYALALGGAVALLGFLLRFERDEKRPTGGGRAANGGMAGSASGGLLRAALRAPLLRLCAAFLLLYVGVEVSVGAWSYSLLTLGRDVPHLSAGWMVSGYWLGLTLGRFLLARLVERWGPRKVIPWLLAGVLVGLAALAWAGGGAALAAAGLWLVGFCLGPLFPSVIALIGAETEARLRQSAIGFAASMGSAGAALFPWVAANLAQRLGLAALPSYVAALTVALLALWLWLRPPPPAPLPRGEREEQEQGARGGEQRGG